ncbi:MAG: rRNA maturation RNase YbeY [bacterium]|nr:rRNA maturation RNase YbeY [bacterium]
MIEFTNLTKEKISTGVLKRLGESVLAKEKPKNMDVSVVFVSAQKMRQLNKTHCGKDKATNVLSFEGGELSLGEIVLCPYVIHKDALEYKMSFKEAISWMFMHGLLHLLGYDHETIKDEKIMTQKEKRYLA